MLVSRLCCVLAFQLTLFLFHPTTTNKAAAQSFPANVEWQVRGLLDLRAVLTDDFLSWSDRGPGKARYGSDLSASRRALLRGESGLVIQARLPNDFTVVTHFAANSQQHDAVDVIESFVLYKPAQMSAIAYRAKVGAFIPTVSLENTSLAWTSPFTISSSAINSWIGEEVRTIGAEGTVVAATEAGEFSTSLGVFGWNDPAGSLLAWRGWSLHDREAGLFDRVPLPRLQSFLTGGSAAGQTDSVRPSVDIDDRAGFYVSGQWAGENDVKLRAMYYDNRANSLRFDGQQYAWHTKFLALGAAGSLGGTIDILAQAMAGNTRMAVFPTFTVVDNDFNSAFILLSQAFGQHRISARAEYFDVRDRDFTRDDPNGERGRALVGAYVYRPTDSQRFTLELSNIRSVRTARVGFGLPVRVTETQIQLSYRYFFASS